MSAPESSRNDDAISDSLDSPLYIFDGPWDTTVRPRSPDMPRFMPRGKQSNPTPPPKDDPESEASRNGEEIPDYSDSPLYIFDGPRDTTVRPRPPHIPPYMPHGKQSEHPPPPEGEPEK